MPVASEPDPEQSLFVPVILTSAGRNNSFFTSKLTLTNRGNQQAILRYTYTARVGGGSGTATDRLAPGRQRIEADGSGDSQPRTVSVTLGARRWTQENGILGKTSQGYVQVRKTSGNNPFITYGVINDGGRPGERSGDGAFLLSQE